MLPMMKTLLSILLFLLIRPFVVVHSFSIEKNNRNNDAASFTLFDRFRASCPADVHIIRQYDPSLVPQDNDDNDSTEDHVWVAVFRSSNNSPSVLIRDEFTQAMRSATGAFNTENSDDQPGLEFSSSSSSSSTPQAKVPVAVARLRASEDRQDAYVMDCMRCMLKKESTDASCDGGSEHCEALSVAIDSLLQYHLSETGNFEGSIRTKASLVAGPLLEDRGFVPVTKLEKDMASHVSSLDACLEKYAQRSISTDVAKSPGSRQRALEIVSLLGRLDRERELDQDAQRRADEEANGDEPIDPWSGFKQFL